MIHVTTQIVAIATVIVDGNLSSEKMKNKKRTFSTKKAIIIVCVIWLLFMLIPVFRLITGKEILSGINDAYVMVGALFTGLAFAVTYGSLLMQNNGLKEQLAMETLSNTIGLILNSDRFRESRKYVMSLTFCNHVKLLEKMKKDDPIFIEDWKKLDTNGEENNANCYEDYEKLIFFCSRMEYLGVVLKNKGIDNTILDYFGSTIIVSYNRLKPFIENSRKISSETTYFHYTYLYYLAKQREPILKQECKGLLDRMAKNEKLFED